MARVTRTLNPLHLEDLEPHRFEDLVRQLLYDFRRWRRLEATGRAGSDDGFDARGWEIVSRDEGAEGTEGDDEDARFEARESSVDRLWLVQCKREKRIGPTQIRRYVLDISEDEINNVHGIAFAAACDFSKATRDAFREACSARGISEWHLWGKAEIEDRLYQPANDHLLFAYFGFSLRIRKRSVRSALVARLAMKRRAAKFLGSRGDVVLLRDATDDRYPYLDAGATAERVLRGRWLVRRIDGLDHNAVRVVAQRHLAVLDDDGKWDYAEQMDDAKLSWFQDPWSDKSLEKRRSTAREEASRVWESFPEHKRAWYEVLARVLFDDILAIDDAGDDHLRHPHIYTGEWDPSTGPFKGDHARLQTIEFQPRTIFPTDAEDDRMEVFSREK